MEETQVLVVGAGPTGLFAAAELARHGVMPRVIDAQAGPSVHSKALAVQSRTLEVFEDIGIADEVLGLGLRLHGANVYASGRRIVHVGFDELDAPHPYVLILPQSRTERILQQHAERLGVRIERQHALVALSQDGEGVTAVVEHGGARSEIRARWVIGCDGSHSAVRRALGASWEGEDLGARFGLADLRVRWDREPDEAHVFFSPEGVMALFPLGEDGRWRIVAALPSDGRGAPETSLETFRAIFAARSHVGADLEDPAWMSAFEVRQRKVSAFRTGRVFLAGDAAHSHSPAGGQGMNTGIQDAYNLAWKLALVCHGVARASLLDSYHAEREPIAAGVLRATGLGTRVVTLRHPVAQAVRNRITEFLTSLEVVQQRAGRLLGELDVSYRGSAIVDEHRTALAGGPRAGERAPDADLGGRRLHEGLWGTRHVLLLFGGRAANPDVPMRMADVGHRARELLGDRVVVRMVVHGDAPPAALDGEDVLLDTLGLAHHRYGASGDRAYVIRPDGYVGFRSQPIDAVPLEKWTRSLFDVTGG